MITVTAKTLRDNLSQYLDRLEKGEEIVIIRRSEIIGSLKPNSLTATSNGPTVAAMLERNKNFFKANAKLAPENVPTKELYHRALDEKHDE
jgi:antitoxin (DNA-binding transcriptional repressor) of toxin-antitoxin stability system